MHHIFKRNSSQVAKVRQLWSYKHSIKMLQENDKCFVSADTEKKYGRYSSQQRAKQVSRNAKKQKL